MARYQTYTTKEIKRLYNKFYHLKTQLDSIRLKQGLKKLTGFKEKNTTTTFKTNPTQERSVKVDNKKPFLTKIIMEFQI